MRTVPVAAPDGTAWSVRVVWQPRWRALARRFGGWRRKRRRDSHGLSDVPDVSDASGLGWGGGHDDGFWGSLLDSLSVAAVVIISLVIVGGLFWWLLLPLLLLAVDAIVVVLLLVLAIAARILFRRPWSVEAVSRSADGRPERHTRDVVGWRNALRTRDRIAGELRSTGEFPPAELSDPRHVSS